jgi:hypothetical protein
MGKAQRDKGYRGEYNLVQMFKENELDSKRVPLSGAAEGFKDDIRVEGYTGEVKVRGNGFKQIYDWLGEADILFIKADYKPYLAVVPIDLLIKLLKNQNTRLPIQEE